MAYASRTDNVTGYTDLFQNNIVQNANEFNVLFTEMLGLTPNNNLTLRSITTFETKSAAPTESPAPTSSPTIAPTTMAQATMALAEFDEIQTFAPTEMPTAPPTKAPTEQPSEMPTSMPTAAPRTTDQTTLITVVVIVVLGTTIALAIMAWFYRSRRQLQKRKRKKG